MTTTKRAVLLFAAFSTLRLLGFAANAGSDGEMWLRWDVPTRNVYLAAYLTGFQRGYQSGCDAGPAGRAQLMFKEGEPIPPDECVERAPEYSHEPSYYVSEITTFYRDNPKFRHVLIRDLLTFLADKPGMKAAQIRDTLVARQKK